MALLVQDQTALTDLCALLKGAPWLALDTEFMRVRTYYAQLALIQIAAGDVMACIDPLAVDIAPLLDIVYDPGVLKIVHAARQDIEVLYDLRHTVPRPVFDTQIAAGLTGYGDQIGYAALVEVQTGTKLAKLETRTDWAARPLSDEQLRYAEDDVRYLGAVYERLSAALADAGRREWLNEDCMTLTEPTLYAADPLDAWRRIKSARALAPTGHAILRALAAWRERTAQQRNLPRAWVVPDAALLDIARVAPTTLDALAGIPALTPPALRHWGAPILQAIAAAHDSAPTTLWTDSQPLTPSQQALCERMAQFVRQRAEQLHISPTLLATRKDIEDLVRADGGRAVSGWRAQAIGNELRALRTAV